MIGLGKALDMPVIAEGVETEGERMFLMREGCPEIQGYLIGYPGPIESYSRHHVRRCCRRARGSGLITAHAILTA